MKGKKIATLAATLGLTGSLLAGCGSDKTSSEGGSEKGSSKVESKGAMENYSAGDTFKATEKLEFSMLYSDPPNYPYKKDWLLWDKLEEMTNVKLDLTIVPASDYEQKRSLLVSSGDAPLIIPKTYPGQETAFVSSGAILPISDYVDLMPNFQETVKKWGLEPELESIKQSDGKYYVLPGIHEELWPDYTLIVRTDILEKNNLPIPTTWDELYSTMKKLKEVYPDNMPLSDRYAQPTPLGSLLNIAAPSFGTKAGWGFTNGWGLSFDKEKDKFIYAPSTNEYKDLLTYFHKLVDENLLDKESLSQTDDQAVQKFTTGKSFMISGNSQEVVSYRETMNKTLGEGKFKIAKITVPAGPKGLVYDGTRLENGIMISAKAKDNPNFKAMLQFIDWLYYSEEGKEFTKWGVEGVTYNKDAKGAYKLTDDVNFLGLNPKGTKDLRMDYGFSGGVFSYGGTTDLLQSTMSEEEVAFQKDMAGKMKPAEIAPPILFSETDKEQATLLSTPLRDYALQNTSKFITGARSLDEFDDFVKELDEKGLAQYVDMANKAYKEYKKNK